MKLSVEKVIEIYKYASTYSLSIAKIAKKFGVSSTTVVAIRDKKIRRDTIEFYENLIEAMQPPELASLVEKQLAAIKSQQAKRSAVIPLLKKEISDARKSAR